VTRLYFKEGRTPCARGAASHASTCAMPRILRIVKDTLPGKSHGQKHPQEQRRKASSLHKK